MGRSSRLRWSHTVDTGLAVMRGLAVLRITGSGAVVERRWVRARGRVLEARGRL